MTRFFLTAALALAIALPAVAQQPPRPREGDDVARLREQVRELEAKLKKESGKKDEKDGEKRKDEKKKDEAKKDEPKGPPEGRPMGGGFGASGFGPMGGFGRGPGVFTPPGLAGREDRGGEAGRPQAGAGGPDFTRMPGFDKLSKDEQKTLTALVTKMRTPTPPASTSARHGGDVEARLDRLEQAIEEIKGLLRGQGGPGGRPGPGGPGAGGAGRGGR